jgi:hypothetical protein
MAHLHPKLGISATVLAIAAGFSPAAAQTTTDDAKARAELTALQLANTKALQEIIASNKGAAEGKATLTDIEGSAEVLGLRYQMERQMAARFGSEIGCGNGRDVVLVFGNQPPTTAHYLSLKYARAELAHNFDLVIPMARDVFGKKVNPPKGGAHFYVESLGGGGLGAVSLGLTGISTLVSLLRVDTELKGAALNSTAESMGPLIAQQLVLNGWRVKAPNNVAFAASYAQNVVDQLRPKRDEAQKYYGIYLARLKAKGDKPEDLPERERVAGQALATVINDYSTLVDGLFKPVEGVLPATVVEQEKMLADAAENGNQGVLYVDSHEAALTSITRKGFLTGLGRQIPAYVSASGVASYTFARGKDDVKFGGVSYQTPVMRLMDVAAWVPAAPTSACPTAGSVAAAQ